MCNLSEGVKEKGRAEGRAEGIFEVLASLVRDGLIALEEAAKRADMSPSEFKRQMKI